MSDRITSWHSNPSKPRFVPPVNAEEPIWPAMRSRWTRRPPECRVLPFRPVLRANGFGEAA